MTRAELEARVTRAFLKVDQTSPVDAYCIIDGDHILARFWLGDLGDGRVWAQVDRDSQLYTIQNRDALTRAVADVVRRIRENT